MEDSNLRRTLFWKIVLRNGSYISKDSLSKENLFGVTLFYIPHILRKPASMKDFPQRGHAAKRPASFLEAAESHLLYGGWLSGDITDIEQYHNTKALF